MKSSEMNMDVNVENAHRNVENGGNISSGKTTYAAMWWGGAQPEGAHAQHADIFTNKYIAYLFPLLFFSLSTSDASDKMCSCPRLTECMWFMKCCLLYTSDAADE